MGNLALCVALTILRDTEWRKAIKKTDFSSDFMASVLI
jgi:hypothetical protein